MVDIAHTVWIHGDSLQIQDPSNWGSVTRYGFCTRIKGKDVLPGHKDEDSRGWVHLAIPTPVIVSDERLRLGSVILRCHMGSEEATRIWEVHVWDGDQRIAVLPGGTSHLDGQGNYRWAIPDHPSVNYGVSISIDAFFKAHSGWADQSIDFIAAGCDFLPP
jgi:uncharacterized protein DUF6623